MQSSDGGWAAFDVDNNWQVLNKVPFADHNAMLDPTCPDITGRVMDALLKMGLPASHSAIERGVLYLLRTQERDGSWYGRWGVNYLYGTFLALRALAAAAPLQAQQSIQRAAEFLRSAQNADGGSPKLLRNHGQHTVANCVGVVGARRRQRCILHRCGTWYRLPAEYPRSRWPLDRRVDYGHRVPQCVLHQLRVL
jgi:hypothetical protein